MTASPTKRPEAGTLGRTTKHLAGALTTGQTFRVGLAVKELYAGLPLSVATRFRIRNVLFSTLPFMFRQTHAYAAWKEHRASLRSAPVEETQSERPAAVTESVASTPVTGQSSLPAWFYEEEPSVFVPLTTAPGVDTRIKAIAFYLPQFHPIPENDRWWGRGFTEWTNVVRGKPQFPGHYQPHVPGELGFYDLRLLEIQRRQIELAKSYGLHGFCYHHYWFGGTRLLRRPLDQLLANPELDFPFCLCWANENWTRRWDGLEADVLIAQQHSPEDDLAFIRDIEPALRDPRYIRIDGRPLLLVYRPALFPDARQTASRWRAYCREAGLGDLFLVSTHAFDHIDPAEFGFDAAVDFAPNNMNAKAITETIPGLNPKFQGAIYDYRYLVANSLGYRSPKYTLFRSVAPMWDNEARRQGRGSLFVHYSPELYGEWLTNVCRYTETHLGPTMPFVFINAWNEWAEGTHLEPDRRFGYAFLQATADALRRFPATRRTHEPESVAHLAPFQPAAPVDTDGTAVILHLYYPELWDEIAKYLKTLGPRFSLFVTIPHEVGVSDQDILDRFPSAQILRCENRGRDIAPFLQVLKAISPLGFKYVCKIHTKRSRHRVDGVKWRQDLLEKLLGSPAVVAEAKAAFDRDPRLGLLAPKDHVIPSSFYWGSNKANVEVLALRSGLRFDDTAFSFAAGSMFWFRPEAFEPLVALDLSVDDFAPEQGQVDGTLAHAMERFFGMLVAQTGYRLAQISTDGIVPGPDPAVPVRYAHAPTPVQR